MTTKAVQNSSETNKARSFQPATKTQPPRRWLIARSAFGLVRSTAFCLTGTPSSSPAMPETKTKSGATGSGSGDD